MANDDLTHRVRRIYASVGMSEETDMSRFVAEIVSDGKRIGMYQDFSGGMTPEEVANLAHSIIHNIAHLEDHLKKWAASHNKDASKIKQTFANSPALQIIKDLSNNDKHGYPPRNGSFSKKLPKLGKVERVAELRPKPEKNSWVAMTLDSNGKPVITGNGASKVVITGDIVDKDDNVIGDFRKIASEAILSWEKLLSDYGVPIL